MCYSCGIGREFLYKNVGVVLDNELVPEDPLYEFCYLELEDED